MMICKIVRCKWEMYICDLHSCFWTERLILEIFKFMRKENKRTKKRRKGK
jgi:hypothetical protein